jgi:hypothetical protein
MPTAVIAAAIGAGGSLLAANSAKKAAGKAADAQVQSTQEANALQKYMFDTTNANQEPWRAAGAGALGPLSEGLQPGGQFAQKFSFADWQADPAYNFERQEGLNALGRQFAAGGAYNSGGHDKAAMRYATGLADSNFEGAYNRFNQDNTNIFNRYASLAGIGQTANQQIAGAGQNYANQAGQNLLSAGNARAQGYANQSGIQTNMFGNLANTGANLFSQYGQQQQPMYTSVPNSYQASGDTSMNGLF